MYKDLKVHPRNVQLSSLKQIERIADGLDKKLSMNHGLGGLISIEAFSGALLHES